MVMVIVSDFDQQGFVFIDNLSMNNLGPISFGRKIPVNSLMGKVCSILYLQYNFRILKK